MRRTTTRLPSPPLALACAVLAACPGLGGKDAAPTVTAYPAEAAARVGAVILQAQGSRDGLSYAWTQTAGPGPVPIAAEATARPAVWLRQAGSYAFQVVAIDAKGTSDPATVKVHVHDLRGGDGFSVAVRPDSTLLTWGDTSHGQLGDGDLSGTPREVLGSPCAPGSTSFPCQTYLTGVVAVAAGRAHALALDAGGQVWAWGEGARGQLGDGELSDRAVPVRPCAVGDAPPCAAFLSGAVAVAAGEAFSLALLDDGRVVAWGAGTDGQLGDGGLADRAVPAYACAGGASPPCGPGAGAILDGVRALAAGRGHALALRLDGSVAAWGADALGQVGDGRSGAQVALPAPVCAAGKVAPCAKTLSGVADVAAFGDQSAALGLDGALLTWGSDAQGALGTVVRGTCTGGEPCATAPTRVCASHDASCSVPLADLTAAALGDRWVLAIDVQGRVWAWGEGGDGQLGGGLTTGDPAPHQACGSGGTFPCTVFMTSIGGVAAGSRHALALRRDGVLYAWGDDGLGQLGLPGSDTDRPVPTLVTAY